MQKDTEDILDFMISFGQPVRKIPTTDISEEERLLRARLVLEEALEFVSAMGCGLRVKNGRYTYYADAESLDVVSNPKGEINLVEAADALGDLVYVTKGSAHTLGVPIDDITGVIHWANMEKLDPITGKPINDEYGKVIKPDGWVAPDAMIALHLENLISGRIKNG